MKMGKNIKTVAYNQTRTVFMTDIDSWSENRLSQKDQKRGGQ